MAINLKSTKALHQNGVKLLVYGPAGAGKTSLIPALPKPIVLSAEGGLLSIAGKDIPYIEIKSMADIRDAYRFLSESGESQGYKSVAIDSISELAEVVLGAEKRASKDPRQAYGAMQDQMGDFVRAFRDLPGRHVMMTAKLEKSQDETGRILYAPSMPGQKMGQTLPYFFDEVLALRVDRDQAGALRRTLLCDTDGAWVAKDRSGRLDVVEEADLGLVIGKIVGVGDKEAVNG
jgi:phage nucleotide-binding protein